MATAKTVWIASDGSQWDNENAAISRDNLDVGVQAIEAMLPERPTDSDVRVALDPQVFNAARRAVVELCRAKYPTERVFRNDPDEIHPSSFAGRFLGEVGGPLNRIWSRFMCYSDGWMYEQPFFARNPEHFKGRDL